MKKISVKRIAFVAIFAAISSLLYCYVKFPLPIFPPFLDVNFSMIPIFIAAFMLGPIDGLVIVIIRFIMKLILVGTTTQYVGEIADLILGLVTIIGSGFTYKLYNGKNRSLISFIVAVFLWVVSSVFLNIFLNIPIFVELFYKGDWNILINTCKDAFTLFTFNNCPILTKDNFIFYYVLLAVIPFNLMLALVVVGITALVHKRLKILYDKINF